MSLLQDAAGLAVFLLAATTLLLLLHLSWRWTLVAIVLQYVAVAWLVSLNWSIGLAAVKLVVGWMAGAVLTASQAGSLTQREVPSGRIFRGLAGGLVLIVIYVLVTGVNDWFQIDQTVLHGALVLLGMGLLQIGLTNDPLRTVVGLLTFLAGFEVLYAALGLSVLVAGLLALVNLSLALACAYLVVEPGSREAG